MALVAAVSSKILKDPASQSSPGVTHFAYWTRRSALKAMAADAAARWPSRCFARPRGLIFHLPPQNVETVFLYSWMIAYLAGNANVTRLPTALGGDMQRLLGLFQTELAAAGDRSQWFVRYPVSQEINRAVSAVCDGRLVWGGDAKVAAFAGLPLRQGGKSIWFGDRRSLAMVNGHALAHLDAAGTADLAGRLHNDIFVFDQMACASPQRVFVVGTEDAHGAAVDALMARLSREAIVRGSGPATGHVIQKMVSSMAQAAAGEARAVSRHSNALTTVIAEGGYDGPPVGGGFLQVTYVAHLDDVARSVAENTQTAVHFGFDQAEIAAFASALPPFGLTRIVPVGQALDFDAIWDGYDLASELCQLTRVS